MKSECIGICRDSSVYLVIQFESGWRDKRRRKWWIEQIQQSWALHESKSAIQVHAVSVFMSSQKRDRLPDFSLKLSVFVALMEIAASEYLYFLFPSVSGRVSLLSPLWCQFELRRYEWQSVIKGSLFWSNWLRYGFSNLSENALLLLAVPCDLAWIAMVCFPCFSFFFFYYWRETATETRNRMTFCPNRCWISDFITALDLKKNHIL